MNVEVIELKPKKQSFLVFLQIVFFLFVFIAAVLTILSRKWLPLLYGALTLSLGSLAWSNRKKEKRKKIAILYFLFSIVTFVSMIMELL